MNSVAYSFKESTPVEGDDIICFDKRGDKCLIQYAVSKYDIEQLFSDHHHYTHWMIMPKLL